MNTVEPLDIVIILTKIPAKYTPYFERDSDQYPAFVIKLFNKSHKAPVPYPTMHLFVTKKCTCVQISVRTWYFMAYFLMHDGICEMSLLKCPLYNKK